MPKLTIDFANAKPAAFSPKHLPEGDYQATISNCEMTKSKSDNMDMILYTITCKGNNYPLYCKLSPTQLWKLREVLEAAGMKVPDKAVQVNPARIVGKKVTVTMCDDEYNGKMKSVIGSVSAPQDIVEEKEEEESDIDDDSFLDFDDLD